MAKDNPRFQPLARQPNIYPTFIIESPWLGGKGYPSILHRKLGHLLNSTTYNLTYRVSTGTTNAFRWILDWSEFPSKIPSIAVHVTPSLLCATEYYVTHSSNSSVPCVKIARTIRVVSRSASIHWPGFRFKAAHPLFALSRELCGAKSAMIIWICHHNNFNSL